MNQTSAPIAFDPALDLKLERIVDVAPELVWAAWTKPEHIVHWFTPAPWTTVECTIDLRPGGVFRTVMRSPEGQEFPNTGTYLEVVEYERLTWTNALLPGFRPATPKEGELLMTGMILLERHGAGTKYTAISLHGDSATRDRHDAMGFESGWGKALDQLVAHMKAR